MDDCTNFASRLLDEDVAMRSLLIVSMELVEVNFFCFCSIDERGIGYNDTKALVTLYLFIGSRRTNLTIPEPSKLNTI